MNNSAKALRGFPWLALGAAMLLGSATPPSEFTIAQVQEVADQKVLAEVSEKNSNKDVRLAAVRRITDQQLLAGIAQANPFVAVRSAAVSKIVEQQILVQVACRDSNKYIRLAALERIITQDALAEVAREAGDPLDRLAALERISDQNILADLSQSGSDPDSRRLALLMLTEERLLRNVLPRVVRGDPDARNRREAVMRIDDQNLLAHVAQEDPDPDVRLVAVWEAVWAIDDQNLLAHVAQKDSDPHVREATRKLITAPTLLETIVEHDKATIIVFGVLKPKYRHLLDRDFVVICTQEPDPTQGMVKRNCRFVNHRGVILPDPGGRVDEKGRFAVSFDPSLFGTLNHTYILDIWKHPVLDMREPTMGWVLKDSNNEKHPDGIVFKVDVNTRTVDLGEFTLIRQWD